MMHVQRKDALAATTQETALSNRWSEFYFISYVQKQIIQKEKENMYLGCAPVTLQGSKHHSCRQQVTLGDSSSSQAQRTGVLNIKKLLINSENSLFNIKHETYGPSFVWAAHVRAAAKHRYVYCEFGRVCGKISTWDSLHCSKNRAEITELRIRGKIYGKEQQEVPLSINALQEAKFGDSISKLSYNSLGEMLLWEHSSNDSPLFTYSVAHMQITLISCLFKYW